MVTDNDWKTAYITTPPPNTGQQIFPVTQQTTGAYAGTLTQQVLQPGYVVSTPPFSPAYWGPIYGQTVSGEEEKEAREKTRRAMASIISDLTNNMELMR